MPLDCQALFTRTLTVDSMARKPIHEEHENHERWLVSYADFITLLFAFFVVMYSISSLNEGKYKVLSDTLFAAFTGQPKMPAPIQQGQPFNSIASQALKLPPLPQPTTLEPVPRVHVVEPVKAEARDPSRTLEKIALQIKTLLKPLIDKGDVNINLTPLGVVIEINAKVLFPSGQATLAPGADGVLTHIAQVIRSIPYQIQVNGFTDNVPIHTTQFQSNWALSAERAVSVVELFIGQGVQPEHLVAAGYGQYHPIASNDDAAGQAKNRRVAIVVVAPQHPTQLGNTPLMPGNIQERG